MKLVVVLKPGDTSVQLDESNIEQITDDSIVYAKMDDEGQDVFDFSNDILNFIFRDKPNVSVFGKVESDGFTYLVDLRQANAFLGVTQSLKNLSKCTRLKVCCVIEKDGRIVSTGLNGTPKGFQNCNERFTLKDRLAYDYSAKHHEFSEAYEVHAEMNAVLELGKNSSMDSYKDLTIYCSTCPCPGCAKMIAQAGIKTVFYHEEYDRLPEGAKNLKEFGIAVFKL